MRTHRQSGTDRNSRINRRARFAGQLYQLSSQSPLHNGAYVEVNGPWDTYGLVIKSEVNPDGTHLNLIRGCRQQAGTTPVASF